MIVRRITYALSLVFLFVLPWEDSISALGLGSLARIMGLVLAAFWLLTLFIEGRFRKPHLFHFLVLLFFLWNAVTMYWSLDTEGTLQRIITYSQIFLALLVFWEIYRRPADLMNGLQAFLFGEYVLVAGTLYNYLNGIVALEYEGRYSAPGVNANDLALLLILGLPVALHLFLAGGRGKWATLSKLVNLAYIPMAFFAIILTGSRTSLLAVIPFGLYIAASPQIRLQRKILLGVVLLISLLALLPFIPPAIISRLGTLGSSIAEEDLGGRVGLWREAIAILARHTLLGVGGGSLLSLMGSAAHNTFLSVATETGLIGFVLFLTALELSLYQAVRLPLRKSILWIALLATWVIGILTLSWEYRKLSWMLLNFVVIAGSFEAETQPEQDVMPGSMSIRQPLATRNTAIKPKVAG